MRHILPTTLTACLLVACATGFCIGNRVRACGTHPTRSGAIAIHSKFCTRRTAEDLRGCTAQNGFAIFLGCSVRRRNTVMGLSVDDYKFR